MQSKGVITMHHERYELEIRLHQKIAVYATYVRHGTTKITTNCIKGSTLLLRNISLNKKSILTDHIWVNLKEIKNNIKDLPAGARLYLTGTVYAYYDESIKRVSAVNYSIKDINIITVDGLPMASAN